jgi:hypothetical protein
MPRDAVGGDSGPSFALFAYGLAIMMVGAVAFNEAHLSSAALSAIVVGNGGAVLAFACAAAVRDHGKVGRGDPGWREYMLGIHAGLAVPTLYSAMCVWRMTVAWENPDKHYVLKYMAVNVLAGLLCVVALLRFRTVEGRRAGATEVAAMAEAIQKAADAASRGAKPPKKGKGTGKGKGKGKAKTT